MRHEAPFLGCCPAQGEGRPYRRTPSCSRVGISGLPGARPQSRVRGNGLDRLTSLSQAIPAFQPRHHQQCRPEAVPTFFLFGSVIYSTLSQSSKCVLSPPKPWVHLCDLRKKKKATASPTPDGGMRAQMTPLSPCRCKPRQQQFPARTMVCDAALRGLVP